jgi:lysophospholipase L1-like esterase
MKKRIIISAAAIVFIAIGYVSIHKYVEHKLSLLPVNTPEAYLAKENRVDNQKVIVCIGDSITHARVSHNYVDLLSKKFKEKNFVLVNAGISGDLAYNVNMRIDPIIKTRPDYIAILIGTNDAWSTQNSDSLKWYMENKSLPVRPTLEWYRDNLSKMVRKLKNETTAKIALLSLPPIGEIVDSDSNRTAAKYNKVIQEVAAKEGLTYLPLHEKMISILASDKNRKPAERNLMYALRMNIFYARHVFFGAGFDDLSNSNGQLFLTDDLHLNSKGASIIADLIYQFINRHEK